MMEEKELRIGNYVNIEDTILRVDLQELYYNSSLMNPIPLTEEWVLKFGFEKDDNEFRVPKIIGFIESVYEICIRFHDDFCDVVLEEEQLNIDTYAVVLPLKLKYVHQLQNLYFALTGQEL